MNVLACLRPGLSNKGIVESSSCLHFHPNCIVTYNSIVSVMVPFQSGIVGSVNANDFYKILEGITEDEVSLVVEGKELVLSAGKTRAGFALNGNSLPPLVVEEKFLPLPKSFWAGVNFCKFSISKDMTRPHLTCIHVQGNRISSSDNWRITQFIMEEPSPLDFLLPGDFINDIVGFPFTCVAKGSSWVHFSDEASGTILSLRLKAGDLIDVDPFFKVEGVSISLPADLTSAIEKAGVMSEGDHLLDLTIQLHLEPNRLVCRGEKSRGWIETEVAIDYSGPSTTFSIHPVFLQEILKHTYNMVIGEKLCLFEGENFRHVLMTPPKIDG